MFYRKNLMLNEFPNSYERLNYYVDDIVKLIDDCRKSNPDGIITLPLLVFKSPLLRFTHCQVIVFFFSFLGNSTGSLSSELLPDV